MLLIHENNFKNKIKQNYWGIGDEIEGFYLNEYLKTKMKLIDIDFKNADSETFKKATDIINDYGQMELVPILDIDGKNNWEVLEDSEDEILAKEIKKVVHNLLS